MKTKILLFLNFLVASNVMCLDTDQGIELEAWSSICTRMQRKKRAAKLEYVRSGKFAWQLRAKIKNGVSKKDLEKFLDISVPGAAKYVSKNSPVGHTPLHLAVDEDRGDLVETLVGFGFELCHRDDNWDTPAMRAARLGKANSLKALVAIDPKVLDDYNDRFSVRRWAEIRGHKNVLQFLNEQSTS